MGDSALRGVKAIATGTYDTCVLAEGFESALCWGDAYGVDDENGHTVPGSYSQVPGTSGLQTLTQGEDPVCGTHRDGSALCWVDELVRRFDCKHIEQRTACVAKPQRHTHTEIMCLACRARGLC